ncbi:unnamed protein product [Ectocarpus fasciculatus]
MHPHAADGTSQTENNGPGSSAEAVDDKWPRPGSQHRISRLRATLVEPIAQAKQDRLAVTRRVALSRVVSVFLVASTTASCLLLQRSGLVDLALLRISVAIIGLLWFMSTFTQAFLRDTRRACNGISLLCFIVWSLSHIMWRVISSEADSTSTTNASGVEGDDAAATPAWAWVDVGIAWAIAPAAGGSLQLSLWGSIVPSWLCVTVALAYGLRAEEVALDGDGADGALVLLVSLVVCGLSALAVGYQVLWEQARDARTLMALEDSMDFEDHRRRQVAFSELLLRHLVTEPSLHVLEAGVKELFKDARIFVMHSDALEQIQDGVSLLAEYGEKALSGLKNGASELPTPVLEKADMEEILDACLRTTAYLAVSRDHHKVQLDLRVAADVDKSVKTYRLWLSQQMTRACLIHALHPDEDDSVILRVSYARPGLMRVGIEAVWRVAGSRAGGGGSGGDGASADQREAPRVLSGWDRDMPAAAWWVRAAALALGGEADYDRSRDREGFHELWFTIPAENVPDDDDLELETPAGARDKATTAAAAAAAVSGGEAASSVRSARGGGTADKKRHSRLGEIDKGPTMLLLQSLQGEEGVSSTTAGADGERRGLEMTAPRAARRESSRRPTLEPLSSTAGAAGAGAAALPRPGAMAASPTLVNSPPLSSSAPSSLQGLPGAKKRGTILPAIQDTETSLENSQTTKVVAFDSDDRARSTRQSVGGAGRTDRTTIGHGYRSSLGGTVVGSSGRGKRASARPNVPPLEGIRVSRVESDADFNPEGYAIRRPSSAPGPTPAAAAWSGETNSVETTAAASVPTTSTPVDRISRSTPNSPERFAAGGGQNSTRRSLNMTVKNLLGTEGGLEKLRESLQEDEANPGKATAAAEAVRAAMRKTAFGGNKGNVSMHKHEAVARAVGQGAAGMAAARLTSGLFHKRPSSAPSPAAAAVTKKASVFGGLVQTLVESNSMNWLGTGKVASNISEEKGGDSGDSEEDTEESDQALEILLVDPQGMIRWVLPRLKEKRFSVTVAHSAEEAMDMILEGCYQVAVVDLHMPRMSGTEFCRKVRAHELTTAAAVRSMNIGGRGGQEGEELDDSHSSTKLLLHTTSAGSVTFDDLEAFLEEGLVDEYIPHPLDLGTLFDFLKLFEEDDDQYGTRKMSVLLEGGADKSTAAAGADGPGQAVSGQVRSLSGKNLAGADLGPQGGPVESGPVAFVARLFGASRAPPPPPPSMEDVGSTFFTVKGRSKEAHAAAGAAKRPHRTDGGGGASNTRTAGNWKPGLPAVSPGLGVAGDEGGDGSVDGRGG